MSLVYLFGALLVLMILILLTLSHPKSAQFAGHIALIGPVVSAVYFLYQIPRVLSQQVLHFKLTWLRSLDINIDLRIDGLSLLFSLLISFIGVAVFCYATQYLSNKHDNLPRFYIYLLLFMFSMLGIVTANNTILMYICWELTSISSFLLISYWYDREASQFGAIISFMITVLGGLALLTGFIMIYTITGTNSISEIMEQRHRLAESPLFLPIVVMLLLGAFTKSAQFPFHVWLPKAMEAPTPVSAYLHSATMVKAGIFLLIRFIPVLGLSQMYIYAVTFIGLITMIFGSVNALRQYDLKAILAYSTISQLGMIVSMIGLGAGYAQHTNDELTVVYVYILFTGLFHLINHALYKGALFMGVGLIDHETGTRDIRKLSGLRHFLPLTHIVMLLSALSMGGVPLLNGFLSKEMFFDGLLRAQHLPQFSGYIGFAVVALGVVASVFTFIYSLYMVKSVFWGEFSKERLPISRPKEPILFALPSIILTLMLPVIFVIPNVLTHFVLVPALQGLSGEGGIAKKAPIISQWHGFNLPLLLSAIVIVVGVIAVFKVKWLQFGRFEKGASLTKVYSRLYHEFEIHSSSSIRGLMNNRLNHYIVWTLLFFGVIVTYSICRVGFPKVHQIHVSDFGPLEILTLIVVFILGVALIFIRQRLTMVILNGIIGYCVTIFFILMKAPDLALTQLVVETITTILFIVSFSRLPNVPRGRGNRKRELLKIVVSLIMAIVVVMLVFIAQQGNHMATISTFYEKADELTGGKNIVNAILGDFRAFDTLFEGLVLIITGLGIYTLLNFKDRRGQDERE
ncbi:DUF4040 family protein [Staphylococcus sp. SQ8-PEA]|uniref:DUF4040 family protein n=1 Tax=Staphylococcus marylandisciuri TaxID=2981529 RepID=A0ABT2QSG9_9STAP|nr:DUF4040 family protein [Staphylococcus marylandisciuri]MCU5746897.1 DUF4040 family protein [Staphylococcus marylandisciuri]